MNRLRSAVGIVLFTGIFLFVDPPFAQSAFFQFDSPPDPSTFVIELTDPVKIQKARNMLSRTEPMMHVSGTILKTPVWYNPGWSYHLDPDSIGFFEMAIEVCDASMQYIEDHLEDVCGSTLPKCGWCPWNSRLVAEVFPQRTKPGDANGDNAVDGNDFLLWQSGDSRADFDGNGNVDGRDFVMWSFYYGT